MTNEIKSKILGRFKRFVKVAEFFFGWQLRKIEAELTETEEKLKTINYRKKVWDENETAASKKFNEDKIAMLRSDNRKNQTTLAYLKATLRLQTDEAKRKVTRDQINFLEDQAKQNDIELKELNEKFKQYLEISGMKIAELEAKQEELKKQLFGAPLVYAGWVWLTLVVLAISFVSGLAIAIALYFYLASWQIPIYSGLAAIFVLFIIAMGSIVAQGYCSVPEKREWIIELFGKYAMTWRAGAHIMLPVFMEISGEIFMEDITLPLQLNGEKNAGGKQGSMVEFLDSSAGVSVDIFYKVFSSYRAVYNIDDLSNAIGRKMEAGIRAYYGNQTIDEAIAGRAEVDLRKIITQNATEADVFKSWGSMITSLAVTNFNLPTEVEKSRLTKLTADKTREVAEITQQTTLIQAETAKIQGALEGNRLKQLALTMDTSIEEAIKYDLMVRRLNAYEKSGLLIVGDQGDAKSTGAIAGAAAQLGAKAEKSSAVETKP